MKVCVWFYDFFQFKSNAQQNWPNYQIEIDFFKIQNNIAFKKMVEHVLSVRI